MLVNSTSCGALPVLTPCAGKLRLVADNSTTGPLAAPASEIDCGEFPALSVSVTAAEKGPATAGSNFTVMVHDAPAARLAPQLFELWNAVGLAPPSAIPVIPIATGPVLVAVTVSGVLTVPARIVPKLSEVG